MNGRFFMALTLNVFFWGAGGVGDKGGRKLRQGERVHTAVSCPLFPSAVGCRLANSSSLANMYSNLLMLELASHASHHLASLTLLTLCPFINMLSSYTTGKRSRRLERSGTKDHSLTRP